MEEKKKGLEVQAQLQMPTVQFRARLLGLRKFRLRLIDCVYF